uniref:G_PROTEIN_RECEP_F1_2 domain-containing protein n=1 Tax=Macrostomum lignano TaxID=282301 RepID=A0A1I8IXQ9_9PLAT
MPWSPDQRSEMLQRYLNDSYLDTLLDLQVDCLVDSSSLDCATATVLGFLAGAVVPVAVAMGTVGNLLTVHVIFRRIRQRTRLHFYLACIALSDWGNLICWGLGWQVLAKGLPWLSGGRVGIIIPNMSDGMCRGFRFAHNFFHALSANWFLLMTLDRLNALYRPLKARSLSLRSAAKAATGAFVATIAMAGPVPAFWGWHRLVQGGGGRIACLPVPFYGDSVRLWTIFSTVLLLQPPSLQMLAVSVCNSLLLVRLCRLRRSSGNFFGGNADTRRHGGTRRLGRSSRRHGGARLAAAEELAPTLVVVALSVVFLMCGLPVCAVGFVVMRRTVFGDESDNDSSIGGGGVMGLRSVYNISDIGQILILVNQSINWAVLLCRDRQFRSEFLAVVTLGRCVRSADGSEQMTSWPLRERMGRRREDRLTVATALLEDASMIPKSAIDLDSCGSSPMIRVRHLSARALVAVVPGHQLAGLAERIIICGLRPTFGANQLHGALLQLAAAAAELAPALPGREERQSVFGRLAGLCLDRLDWLALPSGCCPTLAAAYARALRALLRPLAAEPVLRLLQASDGRLARLIGRRLHDDPATFLASAESAWPTILDEPDGPDMFAACTELACELLRALGQRSAVGHIQISTLHWLLHESPRCPLQFGLLSNPGLAACCLRLLRGPGRPANSALAGLAAEFLASSLDQPGRLRGRQLIAEERQLPCRLEELLSLLGDSPAAGPCLRLRIRLLAGDGDGCGRLLLRLAGFDQPDRLRLAAAHALRDFCRRASIGLLTAEPWEWSSDKGEAEFVDWLDLWEAAVTGLMDDCEEVSAEVCACVSDLAGWVEPACQSKCLDWLIDRLAARRGPPGWSDAIADRLLAWLLAGFQVEQVEASIA